MEGVVPSIWVKEWMLVECVCNLTLHDLTILHGGRVMAYDYIISFFFSTKVHTNEKYVKRCRHHNKPMLSSIELFGQL